MKVMIVCGGTGGHIYPGIALAKALIDKKIAQKQNIVFIGRKRGLEETIYIKENWQYKTIVTSGMPREISLKWFTFIFETLIGIIQSIFIIKKEKPDVIIGTGAYITVPIIVAGKIFNISELILEQNVYPGLAIKWLSKIVDKVSISFMETKKFLPKEKCIYTGNPVRPEIVTRTRADGFKNLNFDSTKKIVLIFGGSLGAKRINDSCIQMKEILEPLHEKISLIIITGNNDFEKVSKAYKNTKLKISILPFIYNMEDALAIADLIVCRAGATTLAEIAIKGIPAILIPYPFATAQHQLKNAQCFEARNASEIILDNELNGEKLAQKIIDILFDEKKLQNMRNETLKLAEPDALDKIVEIVKQITKKGKDNV